MKVNKFVEPKDSEVKYQKYLLLLQNFNEWYLKLTLKDCGSSNFYNIYYQKFDVEDFLPLYFVVPMFYGCVKVIDDENYLCICEMDENSSVLSDHKKLIEAVLEQINKLNGTKYSFKKDYCGIKFDNSVEKIPEGNMLKISYVVVSFRYVLEGKSKLLVEGHLMDCFYEYLSEINKAIINDDFEIIESEK